MGIESIIIIPMIMIRFMSIFLETRGRLRSI